MHVHNEHSRKQTKKRLKHVFQVHTDAEKAAAELAQASASRGATIPTMTNTTPALLLLQIPIWSAQIHPMMMTIWLEMELQASLASVPHGHN